MSSADRPLRPYLRVVTTIRDDVMPGRLAGGDTVPSARGIATGTATPEQASVLRIEIGTPALLGRNRRFDAEGHVVEFGESASRPGTWASYEYATGSEP